MAKFLDLDAFFSLEKFLFGIYSFIFGCCPYAEGPYNLTGYIGGRVIDWKQI